MSEHNYPNDEDVGRLLAAPSTVEQMPGGAWRAEKGGHVGVGPTRQAALRNLGEKL